VINPAFIRTDVNLTAEFRETWNDGFQEICHRAPVWHDPFFRALEDRGGPPQRRRELASVWCLSMLLGSYSFPRYVAALASRADLDVVRHGLLENAWDEAGATHRLSRSHFWLAVRLAQGLGFNVAEANALPALEASARYVHAHHAEALSGDFEKALGMICLIEEFTTPEFTRVASGLLGALTEMHPESVDQFLLSGGGEYFTANIADDERHREEMPKIAAAHLLGRGVDIYSSSEVGQALEVIFEGARYSMSLRHDFLQEIFEKVDDGLTSHEFWGSAFNILPRRRVAHSQSQL
jgi:pyrroloquinoline quinone (PQQ) biosynthesis protein C